MISIQSAVEYQRRLMAATFEVDEITVEPYYEGPLHYAPDDSRAEVADRFTVRIGRERRFFITPVEWEQVEDRSLIRRLIGAKPRYRLKDQREYITRMIQSCITEIAGEGQ